MDRTICFLEKHIKQLIQNKLFLTAASGTLLEYIFFILLLSDGNAANISIRSAVLGVPPILVYIAFVLIPFAFGFLFKGRLQGISLILINLLISLLLIFDLWYYRSNGSFMNYYMFDMLSNLDGLSTSILAMFRPIDLLFLINALVLIIMFRRNIQAYGEARRDSSKFFLILATTLLYLTYNHIKVDKLQRGYAYQYLFTRIWSQNHMMYNLTPLGYHIYDFYNYVKDKRPYILSPEEGSKINNYFKAKEVNLPLNTYNSIFKGKNLIVIQVESLENFVIGEKIDTQEITPSLNRLLSNSIYFSNYREQTYNGTTSDATFVSNTSMLPVLTGNNNFNYPFNYYNSLPRLLKDEGYDTYSLHGEKGSYWNWKMAEKNMGFDSCIDIAEFNPDEQIGLGLSDKNFLSQSVEKISKYKKPHYTFLITLTSHSPFTIPGDQINIKLPDYLKGTKTGNYIESIHYTDSAIGTFIEALDNKGILNDTVIAIYGDHEGIHKFFDDEIMKLDDLPLTWRENDRRVPLIIYSKDISGKKFAINGGQVDFLPTICYLMGVNENKYSKTALGRNLLNTNLDFVVLTDRTYRGTDLPDEEKKTYIDVLQLSNLMIKTDYFKER